VNTKKLNFAVQKYDTFDTIQKKVGDIKQIIVGSMNIDTSSVKSKLKTKTLGSGTLVKQTKMVQS
jgi:hypothetical protein